ncbi:MAG: bi-domain-containing oxidoreductase [Planctomycetaceae bacterium]|nr:bi-domain-containing oxidoreductase [Planctomycetales bacterium]MCB9920678.1 bi-domain-containing oxidoreductase [Planctomycetaceae bacterium]
MKQILQNVRNGDLSIAQLPRPQVQPGHVLVASRCSLISAGTEKSARDLAQKSLFAKAKERPDQVRRTLQKMRQEGIWTTLQQVREKLDDPMPMGYCSAGVVIACGDGVQDFKPGDRVASNGSHADVVCVPKNLCAKIPDGVDFDQAAFTVLGAIAMQGVRLSKVTLGETVLVVGLGLVGQITVALLKAAGARVIGTDLDPAKCELAKQMGATEARVGVRAAEVETLTGGLGADAVLITASTKSNAPIELAANAVRQKGRVVLVGVVGLELDRRPFYFREAEFVVSCSYGPGRYDPQYEEGGHDYPAAYVRWTQQRNMQAVLDLMGSGRLDVSPLISHRFAIDEATKAYDLIEKGEQPYLGILLDYPEAGSSRLANTISLKTEAKSGSIGVSCLGAGNFARMVLLPRLCQLADVSPQVICSAGGGSAAHVGKKLGFAAATSDATTVFNNDSTDAVFVITQHHQHAEQVLSGIRAGKHVFVEKPLCMRTDELLEIEAALAASPNDTPIVMVGFNRRFSPAAVAVRNFLSNIIEPLTVSIRFNAGAIPADHWTQDDELGGGRIIGEACHAIDLATYLTGSPVVRVFAESIGGPLAPQITDDQCFITLRHANGSLSNVAYLAGGDKACPKERVEVIGGGRVAIIDDFRVAEGWFGGKKRKLWKGGQDKGHSDELVAFVDTIRRGGEAPISWEDLRSTTLAAILAVQSLREGVPLDLLGWEGATSVSDEFIKMAG